MGKYIGTPGIARVETSPEFIRGQGWSLSETWKGSHAAINGKANEMIYDGWEFSINSDGPYATLTARRQAQGEDDQVSLDTFTFKREHLTKSIWTLNEVESEANTKGWKEYKEFITESVDGTGEPLEETLPIASFPIAHKVALELSRGADSYEDDYTVLNRKRTVSLVYGQPPLQLKNTALIYTTAQLFSVFNLPAFIHVLMPSPGQPIANAMWGWRSRVEEVVYVEGQKAEIVQDWAFAAWSTNLYIPY